MTVKETLTFEEVTNRVAAIRSAFRAINKDLRTMRDDGYDVYVDHSGGIDLKLRVTKKEVF